jgi:hypothetical protein
VAKEEVLQEVLPIHFEDFRKISQHQDGDRAAKRRSRKPENWRARFIPEEHSKTERPRRGYQVLLTREQP